jgi:hypothetical protein
VIGADRGALFEALSARWRLRAIRNCPGRYILADAPPTLDPATLLGGQIELHTFQRPAARDLILVADLGAGGLISYLHADGTYLHTLNTEDGFRRKLGQLGIDLAAHQACDDS